MADNDREASFLGGGEVHDTSSGPKEATNSSSLAEMVPMNFSSGPGKRKRQDVGLHPWTHRKSRLPNRKTAQT